MGLHEDIEELKKIVIESQDKVKEKKFLPLLKVV